MAGTERRQAGQSHEQDKRGSGQDPDGVAGIEAVGGKGGERLHADEAEGHQAAQDKTSKHYISPERCRADNPYTPQRPSMLYRLRAIGRAAMARKMPLSKACMIMIADE